MQEDDSSVLCHLINVRFLGKPILFIEALKFLYLIYLVSNIPLYILKVKRLWSNFYEHLN